VSLAGVRINASFASSEDLHYDFTVALLLSDDYLLLKASRRGFELSLHIILNISLFVVDLIFESSDGFLERLVVIGYVRIKD